MQSKILKDRLLKQMRKKQGCKEKPCYLEESWGDLLLR